MTEEDRIDQMTAAIAYIDGLPEILGTEHRAQLANITHNIGKIVRFILDRDAGPPLELRSELTRLTTECEQRKATADDLAAKLDKAADVGAGLIREVNRLKEQLRRYSIEEPIAAGA